MVKSDLDGDLTLMEQSKFDGKLKGLDVTVSLGDDVLLSDTRLKMVYDDAEPICEYAGLLIE